MPAVSLSSVSPVIFFGINNSVLSELFCFAGLFWPRTVFGKEKPEQYKVGFKQTIMTL